MTLSPRHTYRIFAGVLALLTVGVLVSMVVVLLANRPPSPEAVAATMTALPSPTPTQTPTPTPIPTLAGVNEDLLVCQREAGREMQARDMVGAVNISDDHRFLLDWFSLGWEVNDLDSALAGVVMAFDVALDVWQEDCAVYDRVQVEVYDRRQDQQVHRLTVIGRMDDLLAWRAGRLTDRELVTRLEVTRPEEAP
jgi:hypothetical protein